MKNDMKNIMNRAWQLVKTYGFTLKEALKKAWAIAKCKAAMYKGIVKFRFEKLDGSIRTAFGTLKSELIPDTLGSRRPNPTVVTYFDQEKGEYRCFKAALFIGMCA